MNFIVLLLNRYKLSTILWLATFPVNNLKCFVRNQSAEMGNMTTKAITCLFHPCIYFPDSKIHVVLNHSDLTFILTCII